MKTVQITYCLCAALLISSCLTGKDVSNSLPAKLSLKDKFNIAKIVLSNGTAGTAEVIKDTLVKSAHTAQEAIASSMDHASIAVEHAKAEYAQAQVIAAEKENIALKNQLATLEQELKRVTKMLHQAQKQISQKK